MPLYFAPEQWTVSVNYNLSLDEMIAAGNFRTVDRNYSAATFPIKGDGINSLVIRLLRIETRKDDTTTQEVLDSMKSNVVRPATLEELLAFASIVPPVRMTRRVFALGTTWCDPDGLVYLPECNFSTPRRLHLCPIRREPWWSAIDDCFACVPL